MRRCCPGEQQDLKKRKTIKPDMIVFSASGEDPRRFFVALFKFLGDGIARHDMLSDGTN